MVKQIKVMDLQDKFLGLNSLVDFYSEELKQFDNCQDNYINNANIKNLTDKLFYYNDQLNKVMKELNRD